MHVFFKLIITNLILNCIRIDDLKFTINDTISWSQTESYDYSLSIIKAKVGFSWYLSDFISHNWFTGALLSLEPSISYNWTIKNEVEKCDENKREELLLTKVLFLYK